MADLSCVVGRIYTDRAEAVVCAAELEQQNKKSYFVATKGAPLSKAAAVYFTVEEDSECVPGALLSAVFGAEQRALRCAASLTRITGKSYAVVPQSGGLFSTTYSVEAK